MATGFVHTISFLALVWGSFCVFFGAEALLKATGSSDPWTGGMFSMYAIAAFVLLLGLALFCAGSIGFAA